MTTKDRLHQLTDALPDSEIATAERFPTERGAGAAEEEEMTIEDRLWLETDKGNLWKHEPYE